MQLTKNKKKKLKLYSQKAKNALEHIVGRLESGGGNAFFYTNQLAVLVEAVLDHGRKLGASEVFAKMDAVKKTTPHRLPGRPKGSN